MQIRNADSVLPDPVGAEISVVRPARISGQPCSCGSVGEPNLRTNHSATSGCAHPSDTGISTEGMLAILDVFSTFANSSLHMGLLPKSAGQQPFTTESAEKLNSMSHPVSSDEQKAKGSPLIASCQLLR